MIWCSTYFFFVLSCQEWENRENVVTVAHLNLALVLVHKFDSVNQSLTCRDWRLILCVQVYPGNVSGQKTQTV